ncbi:interleukin-17 receptor B [Centroberyx affinis]|uniref:interleukin-17 receptor B n=1 Tax=Centroberyx affinis TaxID=166261 RepID=UPI003A5C1AB6
MWGATLVVFFCAFGAQETSSHEIGVTCDEKMELPPYGNASPSLLKELKMELVTEDGDDMLNISWAINVDVSIEYLTATRIVIAGELPLHCEYNPPLAKANLTGLEQVWFHYLVPASTGQNEVSAANLPLPPLGSGLSYKSVRLWISPPKPKTTTVKPKPTAVTVKPKPTATAVKPKPKVTEAPGNLFTMIAVPIFGVLTGLILLISCFIIYKRCGANFSLLGFTRLPTSPMVPVSVLLVYPAEDPLFQRAVVALAEFLQWHGGCSVAVDMWQQGKIAELGPMRWLAEQAKAADRVIVICPQPSHCPPSHGLSGHSIPAAARDLYPLILNMVGSHAKSPGELAKFWAVRLGERQDKGPGSLAVELRACRSFCLMKDLNKLCRNLHTQRQDSKATSGLKFRAGIAYSETNTVKLRDAVGQLARREGEPLKTVITGA